MFSKCVRDLIVENDRVAVPHLGVFSAMMMPASYSDRQTTIHPPYRKMQFHKEDVSIQDGALLLDKIVAETGVSQEQAGVELGWCLSRLCSELEGRKSCKLPGLGTMRANARNEFFFVPDEDLDIWPDGLGFESISIKVSERVPEPELATEAVAAEVPAVVPEPELNPEPEPAAETVAEEVPAAVPESELNPELELNPEPEPEPESHGVLEEPKESKGPEETLPSGDFVFSRKQEWSARPEEYERMYGRRMHPLWVVAMVVGVLLILFVAASYLFTEEMSPILDRLLYTKEELKLLGR